jgi:CheY-like chemotaxis protein
LLAEDNPINQQVAEELLTQTGLKVTIANNGREAVEMLDNEDVYDAVLMDVQMPEMDGYEATGAIRQRPEFKDLPIIAMTANVMAGDREKCLERPLYSGFPRATRKSHSRRYNRLLGQKRRGHCRNTWRESTSMKDCAG